MREEILGGSRSPTLDRRQISDFGCPNPQRHITPRYKQGESFISDDRFAGTREQPGGYYVLDADDLDGEIASAKRIPLTANRGIEIRNIVPRGAVTRPQPRGSWPKRRYSLGRL